MVVFGARAVAHCPLRLCFCFSQKRDNCQRILTKIRYFFETIGRTVDVVKFSFWRLRNLLDPKSFDRRRVIMKEIKILGGRNFWDPKDCEAAGGIFSTIYGAIDIRWLEFLTQIGNIASQNFLSIIFGGRNFSARQLLAKKDQHFKFLWRFVYIGYFFHCFIALLSCKPAQFIPSLWLSLSTCMLECFQQSKIFCAELLAAKIWNILSFFLEICIFG